jgi:serine/threonine protein kinase
MALLERIGRYEVRAEIGHGGMSTIYAARDPVFNRDVAIKVLPAELLHDPTFRTRFEREARTIASLEHPSIVPVYDFGEHHGQPYLVMRLMSGGSLSERVKKGPMSLAETARIVSRIAPALDQAHRSGIVHRDLKPANILFDQNGEPYVVDFGIAKLSESGATLTGSGIIGTPAYMSPEQARGESDIDGRSDIYSLGVTVFEMLAGRVPYESDAVMGQMVKHIVAPLPNILDLRADLPQDVQTIMIHALAKRKFARYATAGEMAKALTAVAEGKPLPTDDGASTPSAMTGNTMDLGVEASGQERRVTPQPKKTPTPPPRKTPTPTRPVPPTSTYVSQKETAPAKKRSLILWGLLALVLVAAASIGVVLAWPFLNQGQEKRTATPVAQFIATTTEITTPAVAVLPTLTLTSYPKESPTQAFTSPPSMTRTATSLPTQTEIAIMLPTATLTPALSPTATITPTAVAPVISGVDKIAFVKENNIWIANVDGTDIQKLTTTGGTKSSLQWTPDGQAVNYIQGKCAHSVNIHTGAINTLICPNWADYIASFQISPDGKYVALSLNDGVYILPYDLDPLNQITRQEELQSAQTCTSYTETPTKAVLWSKDSASVAVVIVGSSLGRQEEMVRVLSVATCRTPVFMDEFPGVRFTPNGYAAKPVIASFGWDGKFVFAMNVDVTDTYGDMWQYNINTKTAKKINVIGNLCCFRDFRWSPDGKFIIFAYEDNRYLKEVQLYFTDFGTLGTGAELLPIPFPEGFFGPREKPQPALRPAQ